MNRRMRMLTAALAAATAIASGSSTVQAAPPESSTEFCSAAQLDSGECLTAVVAEGGSISPEQAAVSQAIARGELAKARNFVAARGNAKPDAEQGVLEGLVSAAAKGTPKIMEPSPGGRIVGGTHFQNGMIDYLYCNGSTCSLVGKVGVEYRTVLNFYPTVTLDGEWWVQQGPSVDFTAAECLTRYDQNSLPDTTVRTWSNCPAAHNAHSWTFRALVNAQNWSQGGTRGANYFMRYRLTFKTSAGNQPMFGPWEWETYRYKVSSTGGSAAWHT
ncbi:hypothetical protein ACFCV3_38625 [Kribbella sp. NPDC056345]|uniref:hypothetical protein n=1 Tax=Kribbella sp. NPDC056345 TaxID=3345789 RepID=UPI0035DE5600